MASLDCQPREDLLEEPHTRYKEETMRRRSVALVSTFTLLSGAFALPASASPPSTTPPGSKPPATIGHSATATVQCNGSGTFTDNFTTDANARFGQEVEVAAFNSSPQTSECQVVSP
jgi:hypothetical protein